VIQYKSHTQQLASQASSLQAAEAKFSEALHAYQHPEHPERKARSSSAARARAVKARLMQLKDMKGGDGEEGADGKAAAAPRDHAEQQRGGSSAKTRSSSAHIVSAALAAIKSPVAHAHETMVFTKDRHSGISLNGLKI